MLALSNVAVSVPLEELKVRLVPLLGAKSPVAAVANSGKQVVSELSSATVTLVAVVDDVALPLKVVAVTTPETLIPPVPDINLLLRSKLPPNCGVVSSTTFLRNVLANLPSAIEPANCALVIVPVKDDVG